MATGGRGGGDGEWGVVRKGTVVVHFRPGSAAEEVAKPMASAAAKARRALEGFGSEPGVEEVRIFLDDAFRDPDDADRLVTAGTVVDKRTPVTVRAGRVTPTGPGVPRIVRAGRVVTANRPGPLRCAAPAAEVRVGAP